MVSACRYDDGDPVAASREARRRSVRSAIDGERRRCAGIIELVRNKWIKHTHQDEATRLLIDVLDKCVDRIRTEP